MQNAFDRLGNQGDVLSSIEENTRETKEAVAVGGDLYSRIDELVTAITDIQEGKSGGGNDIKQALALAIVAPSIKGVGMGLQYVVDAVNNLEGSGEEVSQKLEALVGGLTKLGDVGKSILLFAGYMLLATPLLLITAAASPIIAASLFVLIGGIMLATKSLDEKKLEAIERLKDVGLGLLAFTGALVLISFVQSFALKGLLGAIVIIGAIALVTRLIPEKKVEQLEAFGMGMLKVALGLAAMAAVFALLSFIVMPALTGALVALAIIAAIGATFFLLEKLKVIDKIEDGAKGLLLAAGAILGLGIALALFNIIAPPLEELLNIALVVGVVALAFGLVGIFGKQIYAGARALLLAGLSIVVLGLSLNLFQKLTGNLTGEDAVRGLGALIFIGLIAAGFYLAGTQAVNIMKGAAAMILVGISLLIIAAGTAIMSKALGDNGFTLIGQIALLIGGLAIEMGLAGLAAPFIAAGAGALILAGVALLTIAAGIAVMNKLDFKSGALAMSGQKTKEFSLFGMKFGGRPKTNLEVALEAVGDAFMLSPLKIGAMYLGAPALLMAGLALLSIGAGIRSFQRIAANADLPTLGENVNKIVKALSETFAEVGKKYGGGGFMGFGGGDVYKGIQSTQGMGRALTGIAKGVQAMANLKFPTGFDKEGQPTGYETINLTEAIPNLLANTKEIIRALTGVFAEIGSKPEAQRSWFFGKSAVEKGIEMVAQFGMPLFNLAKGVQAMADLKFPTGFDKEGKPTGYETIKDLSGIKKKIGNNTKLLIQALTDVFTTIGNDNPDASSSWWQGSSAFEKGIEIVTTIAEPYKTLGDSVKGIIELVGKLDTKTFAGKVKDIINVFTQTEDDTDVMLIATRGLYAKRIGESFEKLGSSVPSITQALATFKAEQGRAFFGAFVGPVDEGNRANGYAQQNHMWKAIGSAMVKTKESMPGITSAVNEMDMDKLVESRKMFEALAVLGEGGDPGDILAAMGESLEEALNNLADLLTQFRGTVEEGVTAQTEATGGLLGAVQSFIPGGGGGGGNQTVKVDNDEVVAAVKNLQSVLISQGIKVKSSGGFFS